jgi:mono/diheme cytochrome c family protein
MKLRVLAVSVGVLVLLAFTASLALAQTGDPAAGRDLWAQNNCKSCHGANGEGAYAGPRAGDGLTAEQWIAQVRQPRNQMPAYRPDQVSDQAIADMNAYMQTQPRPASFSPTVAQTSADDPPGKILLAQKRCVACHANFAQGLVQANFTDQGRQVTFDAVLKQVRDPFRRMPIFGESKLSVDEVRQIADFLASYQTQAQITPGAQATPAATAAVTATMAVTATATVAATPAAAESPAAATPAAAATAAPPASLPTTGGDPGALLLTGLLGAALLLGGGLLRRRN